MEISNKIKCTVRAVEGFQRLTDGILADIETKLSLQKFVAHENITPVSRK